MNLAQLKNGLIGWGESIHFACSIKPRVDLGSSFDPKNVLVFGYMGIGDLLMLRPALEAFKKSFPNCRLTYLTGPYSSAVQLARAMPIFDRVWPLDWKNQSGATRQATLREIESAGFDVLLATYTAPIRFFLPALIQIPVRIGAVRKAPYVRSWRHPVRALRWWFTLNFFREEWFRHRVYNFPISVTMEGRHEIQKGFDLVKPLGVPSATDSFCSFAIPTEAVDASQALLKSVGLSSSDFIVAVQVSASPGQRWKVWPIENYENVILSIVEKWNVHIIFMGTKEEEALLSSPLRNHPSGRVHRFDREVSVMEMAGLIRLSRLFLGGDSGPGHLSLAVGTPSIRIFGPTDQDGYGVWAPGDHIDMTVDLSCRPCVVSGLEKPGVLNILSCPHKNCLNQLTVASVLNQAEKFLTKLGCEKTS